MRPPPDSRGVSGATLPQLAALLREVRGRPLEVHLSEATEARLRAHIYRCNAEIPDEPFGFDDDDLAVALAGCADHGLAESEREHGLESAPGGTLRTLEQAEEERRRREPRS